MVQATEDFGTGDLKKLLLRQAVPASVGIVFLTLNMLIDTVLVGRWIGSAAVAALTVVGPITFLMASFGLAVGVGGSSVLSRALGSRESKKASKTLGHQFGLTALITSVLLVAGLCFPEATLEIFGAQGTISEPARAYYYPLLLSGPLMAVSAMASSVMRAEDQSRSAMIAMIIPSAVNLLGDVVFIKVLDMGVFGAAMASAVSFACGFLYVIWYFAKKSKLRLGLSDFIPDFALVSEISGLSFTTFARQSVIAVLSVLLNHVLFDHGGETSVTVYGIISRMLMFALFPVNGITQGFMPIAGYNIGAKKFDRVRGVIKISLVWACVFAIAIYAAILIFAEPIVRLFITDEKVLKATPNALRWVFAASPVIAVQLIGSAYFQAAGKALKSLLLTLTKQGFFLIPLILILPDKFGIFGVWVSFPIADVLATLVTGSFLLRATRKLPD